MLMGWFDLVAHHIECWLANVKLANKSFHPIKQHNWITASMAYLVGSCTTRSEGGLDSTWPGFMHVMYAYIP